MEITIKENNKPVTLTLPDSVKMDHIDRAEKAIRAYEKEHGEVTEIARVGHNLAVLVTAIDGVPISEGGPYSFDRFYQDLDWDPKVMEKLAEVLSKLFRSTDIA